MIHSAERSSRGRGPRVAVALAAFAVVAGGCSSSSSSSSSSPAAAAATSAPATTAGAPATVMVRDSKLGSILTDSAGKSLYVFDKDQAGAMTSACTGGCAAIWPALTVTGTPTAGPGVPGQLSAAGASGGGTQVAWNGRLLYEYSRDQAPGDTNGDGVGGIWHVAKVTATAGTTSTTTGVGGY